MVAMNPAQASRTVTVANRAGLHARAALLVANCVREFQAKVELVMDRQRVDALDMLQVLSLGAGQGQSITLEATGVEAEAVLDSLERLFAARFHEDDGEGEDH